MSITAIAAIVLAYIALGFVMVGIIWEEHDGVKGARVIVLLWPAILCVGIGIAIRNACHD